jgi:hypothetical protein
MISSDREPVAHAVVCNASNHSRELVVGLSQSPGRNRFTLLPGQQRELKYAFVGQANLIVAELRDGDIAWEHQVGNVQFNPADSPLRIDIIRDALVTQR